MTLRLLSTLALALVFAGCGTPRVDPSKTGVPQAEAIGTTYAFDGGQWQLQAQGAACSLRLSGEIHAGTVRRLNQLLQDPGMARCTQTRVLLDTGPALLGDALTLGAMIRNRGYDTEVMSGRTCGTPCLMVFAAGVTRTLAEQPAPARLTFSQLPPDHDFGHQTCRSEPSRAQQLTVTRYLRAMLPPATATAVYQKILAADCRTADTYGPAEALAMGLATATR